MVSYVQIHIKYQLFNYRKRKELIPFCIVLSTTAAVISGWKFFGGFHSLRFDQLFRSASKQKDRRTHQTRSVKTDISIFEETKVFPWQAVFIVKPSVSLTDKDRSMHPYRVIISSLGTGLEFGFLW